MKICLDKFSPIPMAFSCYFTLFEAIIKIVFGLQKQTVSKHSQGLFVAQYFEITLDTTALSDPSLSVVMRLSEKDILDNGDETGWNLGPLLQCCKLTCRHTPP